MINELYCTVDSEVLGGSSYVESRGGTRGKTRALIFLWIDTNWQQNAFLTSLSPSAPPACEHEELPTPEIIPSLAEKNHQGLKKICWDLREFFPSLFASKNFHRRHRFVPFSLCTHRVKPTFKLELKKKGGKKRGNVFMQRKELCLA